MSGLDKFTSIRSGGEVSEFITELCREIRSLHASRVSLECRGDVSQVRFYCGGEEPRSKVVLPTDVLRAVHVALHERAFLWPDGRDQVFATNTRRRRILCAPECGFPLMGDLIAEQHRDRRGPSLVIENIITDGVDPIIPRLHSTPRNGDLLKQLLTIKSGIVLCSPTSKGGGIDSSAIVLSLRPDAALYVSPSEPAVLSAILQEAQTRLVVITHGSDDSIEIIFDTLALFAGNAALETQFLNSVVFTYVHKRVRQVCGNCARPTVIGPSTLEKIPHFLLPSESQEYMFGRGCALCGHAAYRGTVGIESCCLIDETLRGALQDRLQFQKLFALAYERGVRTVFEDGLSKIQAGLTSYEEVLGSAKKPPESLGRILTDRRIQTPVEEPHESPIQIPESSLKISDEAFFINSPLGRRSPEQTPVMPTILIVEDDEDQRSVLELVFKNEGYTVRLAGSALEALKLLREGPADLIVCDLMMPEISGEEFTVRVKSDPLLKSIPVVILTAVESQDAEYTSLTKGADDYIPKTIKRKLLLKRVEKLLARISH